jgi:hypothetical protein
MRGAVERIDDLLAMIQHTELGSRAHEHGVQLWAIDCARRAVDANREVIDSVLAEWSWQSDLDQQLERLVRFMRGKSSEREIYGSREIQGQCELLGRRHEEAPTPDNYRALWAAMAAAAEPEGEALSQLRRLLIWTKLVPSGPELLVRLDYAESRGRLPEDPPTRTWIAEQRLRLMGNDEPAKFAVTMRCFDLVFLAELEQLAQRSR